MNQINLRIKKSRTPKFPRQLLQILNSNNNCIVWDENGTQIVIKNRHQCEEILQKYFKHASLSSFLRQLNFFQFKSTKDDKNQLTYSNPNFTRQKQQITKKICHERNNFMQEHQKLFEQVGLLKQQQQMLIEQIRLQCEVLQNLQISYMRIFKMYRTYLSTRLGLKDRMRTILFSFYHGLNTNLSYGHFLLDSFKYFFTLCYQLSKMIRLEDEESIADYSAPTFPRIPIGY